GQRGQQPGYRIAGVPGGRWARHQHPVHQFVPVPVIGKRLQISPCQRRCVGKQGNTLHRATLSAGASTTMCCQQCWWQCAYQTENINSKSLATPTVSWDEPQIPRSTVLLTLRVRSMAYHWSVRTPTRHYSEFAGFILTTANGLSRFT